MCSNCCVVQQALGVPCCGRQPGQALRAARLKQCRLPASCCGIMAK